LGTPSCAALNGLTIRAQDIMCSPSRGKVTPFWLFELLQNFLTRKQLCSSFLLSDRKRVHRRNSRCLFRQRQGHPGSVIACIKWELPAGSFYEELAKLVLQTGDRDWGHSTAWRPGAMQSSTDQGVLS